MKPLVPLTQMGSSPILGQFLLLECDSFEQLICLPPVSRHFALFTAFDLSGVSSEGILLVANHLIDRGLAYASCWGEDCKRWHDAIDAVRPVDLHDDDRPLEEQRDVLMTTWHDGEPLDEALFFFGRLALPTPRYAVECRDYVIAATSNYVDLIRTVVQRTPMLDPQ